MSNNFKIYTMKTKISLIILVLIVSLSSCRKAFFIQGNNSTANETRQLNSFNKIANDGSFIVTVINDTTSYVVISAESNLIPYIRTIVDGDALIIDSRESLNNHSAMRLEVHTAHLEAIELNGSGEISFDSFSCDKFSAVLNGSGNIKGTMNSNSAVLRVDGSGLLNIDLQTKSLAASVFGSGDIKLVGASIMSKMEVHGSGNIKYYDFVQSSCEALTDGSGSIYVNVTEQLDVRIEGSGSVYYIGNPEISVDISGSGKLVKQ